MCEIKRAGFGIILTLIASALTTSVHAQNVIAWGYNNNGAATVPQSASNVVAVAASTYNGLALRADGSLVMWGYSPYRVIPPEATNILSITAAGAQYLALRADGRVFAWGTSLFGANIVPANCTNAIAIAAGNGHNLALLADRTVVAWGDNSYGQTNVPSDLTNVIAIAAGTGTSIALKADGSVVKWGLSLGSPGISTATAVSAAASRALYLDDQGRILQDGSYLRPPKNLTNIINVSAGERFCLALDVNGKVYGWPTYAAAVPQTATNIASVAVGDTYGLAVQGTDHPRLLGPLTFKNEAFVGSRLPLRARAVGGNLSFQWFQNGVPVPGETNLAPSFTASLGTDDYLYHVVVSNSVGSVTSSVVRFNVKPVNVWGENNNRQRELPATVTNSVSLVCGGFHSLALQSDGTVVAWGKNTFGQTNVPVDASNVVMIAAGADHSLALRNDGTVVAWGKNTDGQCNVPSNATNVVAISAGWAHSLALRSDGTVVAWGNNDYGQASVSFLATRVIGIAAGYYHTLALRSDGTVVSWGFQNDVPVSATNITAIAAGWGHNLALRSDGTILSWGDNTYGQSTVPSSATNVIAIAAGWYQSLALRADGSLVDWGKRFVSIDGGLPSGTGFVNISAGEDFASAAVQQGPPRLLQQVSSMTINRGTQLFFKSAVQGALPMSYQWSQNGVILDGQTNSYLFLANAQLSDSGNYELIVSNAFGQTSSQTLTCVVAPQTSSYSALGVWGSDRSFQTSVPPGINQPIALAAGGFHTLALQADGRVVAWGKNFGGQTNVPGSAVNVIAVAAGSDHSLALQADGTVLAWGRNLDNQTNVPPSATNVIAIAAGWAHSVALRGDGTVIAWGNNDYGQTNVPAGLADVVAIAAGYYHTLALRADHTVIAWGSQSDVPTSAREVVTIAAGWEHNLALKADGHVLAWGDNSYGQCSVPATVTHATEIQAGYGHSLARMTDGRVISWGVNRYSVTNVPIGLADVAAIGCGEDHQVALISVGAPQVRRAMSSLTAHVGGSALLKSEVGGSQPLTLQWYRNGSIVPGATNALLLLTNVQPDHAGSYALVARNEVDQTTGDPIFCSVSASPYFFPDLPSYRSSLNDAPTTFQVKAVGSKPISYRWLRNDEPVLENARISGAGSPILSFNPGAAEDSGTYSLVLSNSSGAYTGLVAQASFSQVTGWGDNSAGQLNIPPGLTNVIYVCGGGDHSLALLADGTVRAWGDNTYHQNDIPEDATNVVAIADGETHSLALKADGTIVGWGDNTYGQSFDPRVAVDIYAISAGDRTSRGLQSGGAIQKWGWGGPTPPFGPLKRIVTRGMHTLGIYSGAGLSMDEWGGGNGARPLGVPIIDIAAANPGSLALFQDGRLLAWGRDEFGLTNIPPESTNVVALAAGDDHFLVLRGDGSIVSWGNTNARPHLASAISRPICGIGAGSMHSLAIAGQPHNRVASFGDSLEFSAGAQDLRLSSYQWQFNGNNLEGATNSTLNLNPVSWINSGTYRVVVSNALGITMSPPMTLTMSQPPLTFDPSGLVYNRVNGSVRLRVSGGTGTSPIVCYASTDLINWFPVFTNTVPSTNAFDFIDSPAEESPQRYYRAQEQR